jgi:hypothetical protein
MRNSFRFRVRDDRGFFPGWLAACKLRSVC